MLQQAFVNAEFADDHASDIVPEIGGLARHRPLLARAEGQKLGIGFVGFPLRNGPRFNHDGKNGFLPVLCIFHMIKGRIIRRSFGNSRQQGALRQGELFGGLAEIQLRSRLDPVSSVPVVNFVQIHP
ncbi:hypothetical protein D1872_282850 [compost metagenome]